MKISLSKLFELHDISSTKTVDEVLITEQMSGMEEIPENDWLHIAISEFKKLKGQSFHKAAFIGSGNGVDVIAALRIMKIEEITVTDILPNIIDTIKSNIERNTPLHLLPSKLEYVTGRDCINIEGTYDFIYANLPLIMVNNSEMDKTLSTTTLTDITAYERLEKDKEHSLYKWSLLSQLGFLLSAKSKLSKNGIICTLIGGRVPNLAIQECFKKANLKSTKSIIAIKRQSDAQYMKEYSDYEQNLNGESFVFYNEDKAKKILNDKNMSYPCTFNIEEEEVKIILHPAEITAKKAYEMSRNDEHIAHLCFGFYAMHMNE